ncbi:hypothetical protein BWQ96_07765 [Gracilariopsis chorda]|uniref:Uncharacterized protein n=1 Tax=Gracilariopsis chorda TaxID=448386 RepID=A0A2V3IKD2_9FLOR|nr:hypothetical protein BWQ96_07765 [Gracilariopsis chorda]|eukprot:PXF42503.1 hypothetical protein BWQ96_07765 [Gracilariopsis chorda]
MQNALCELGTRKGDKLGSHLEKVKLEILAEGQRQSTSSWISITSFDPNGGASGGERYVPSYRVLDLSWITAYLSVAHHMRKRSKASQLTFRFESALATSVVCASQNASLSSHGQGQWAEADVRGAKRPLNSVKIALHVARVVDELFRDYEERAKGAQRIMNPRIEGKDAYEHAVAVCTKLRDQLESWTGSMWDGRTEASNESLERLGSDVHRASNRLKQGSDTRKWLCPRLMS